MFSSFDIISIGDMSIDIFLQISEAEANVHCSVNKEDCQICFNYGDKLPVEKMTKTIGGNASNIAVGGRRLGFRTALVTTLGKDEEAKYVAKELWKEKVDTEYIKQDKRTNFTAALNYLGERTLFVYHEPRNYHLPRIAKAKYIYLTSMRDGWENIIDPLTAYLDRTQAKFAYNPGTYQLRAGVKLSQSLLDRCEVLFVNRQEAELFADKPAGTDVEKLMNILHSHGPRIVVVTDGPKGSYISDVSAKYMIGIYDVPVIERTGCGDAYATGFMSALIKGKSPVEAMRWGSFNAASVLQQIGPQAGLLTIHEIHEHEKKYEHFQPKELRAKK